MERATGATSGPAMIDKLCYLAERRKQVLEEAKSDLVKELEELDADEICVPVAIRPSAGDHAYVKVPKDRVIAMVNEYGAAWQLHKGAAILTPVDMIKPMATG